MSGRARRRAAVLTHAVRPARLALAALALAALALAPAALAGTGRTATATSGLMAPGKAGPTATCRTGTRATGGGFRVADAYIPPPSGTGARTITQTGYPATRRAWSALTLGFGAAVTTEVTAYVRCEALAGTTLVTASTAIDPGKADRLQPRCPPTRRAVGGGFRVRPSFSFTPPPAAGPLIIPLESRRVGERDWRVTAANVNATATVTAGKLTAYAICASGAGKVGTASATATIATNQRSGALARCPPRWHTLSGGFRGSPIFDDPTGTKYVLPEFDVSAPQGSRGWKAGASISSPFIGSAASGRIVAFAYCEHN